MLHKCMRGFGPGRKPRFPTGAVGGGNPRRGGFQGDLTGHTRAI